MDDNDAQLPLKKRARRRLVGAVFFVSVVAVVLPMVMDHEPRQAVQDVEIRIPGQDEKPFAPKFAGAPIERSSDKPVEASAQNKLPVDVGAKSVAETPVKPTARILETVKDGSSNDRHVEKSDDKPVTKSEKTQEKNPEKPVAKPVVKPSDKTAERPNADDAKRAAAILAGQTAEAKPAAKGGEYLVLIGAFSNEANVKMVKDKLTELGIKTFTEPLNTPQGKKTRVRAGPFANRDAADKALAKMKRVGVSGVVSAKP